MATLCEISNAIKKFFFSLSHIIWSAHCLHGMHRLHGNHEKRATYREHCLLSKHIMIMAIDAISPVLCHLYVCSLPSFHLFKQRTKATKQLTCQPACMAYAPLAYVLQSS